MSVERFEIGDKVKVYLHDGSTFEGEIAAVRSGYLYNLDMEYAVKSPLTQKIVGWYPEDQLDMLEMGSTRWQYPTCDMGCKAVNAPRHVPMCSMYNWQEFKK